ncbi:MAG: hypothetical protein COA42_19400 [Alteromonadaceae bacterium]|nr:MAG: hypothetical protein COA42_19400 [Alteromonadaceae bacterium]
MIIRASLTALILCFTLITTAAQSSQPNFKKLHKARWQQVESENFRILINGERHAAIELAQELEDFRHFIAVYLGFVQQPLSEKVPVILAKDKKTYKALGIPKTYGGLFASNNGYAIFTYAGGIFAPRAEGERNRSRETILHELTHMLMENSTFGYPRPVWFNEGIADYFSSYRKTGGQIRIGDIGGMSQDFVSMYDFDTGKFKSVDVEPLLKSSHKMVHDLFEPNGGRTQATVRHNFYIRSLWTVHYLHASPERWDSMFKYLRLLGDSNDVDTAFKQAFNTTYAEMNASINNYISQDYLIAPVFDIEKRGIHFPKVSTDVSTLEKRTAATQLYQNISKLGGRFWDMKDRDNMTSTLESYYPDFFSDANSKNSQFLIMDYRRKAWKKTEDKNYAGANKIYQQAFKRYPKNELIQKGLLFTWDQLGTALFDKHQWKRSAQIYEAALKVFPDDNYLQNRLSEIAQNWAKAKPKRSDALYTDFLKRYPNNKSLIHAIKEYELHRLQPLLDSEDYKSALRSLDKSVVFFEKDRLKSYRTVYLYWAQSYIDQGEFKQATQIYHRALKQFPKDDALKVYAVSTWHDWAEPLIDAERWTEAISIYQQAVKNIDDESLSYNLAYCENRLLGRDL